MPEIERVGCRIWYESDGARDAPALLLLNSLGATIDMWAPQLPALGASRRIIRFDYRGHGRSGTSPGPYPLDLLGRDALAVLDAAGAPSAAVCGISLGGMIAMWLGCYAAERVERLVLTATGAKIGTDAGWNDRIAAVMAAGPEAIATAVLSRWFTAGFRDRSPEVVAPVAAALGRCSAEGYAGCAAAVRDADLRDAIGGIRVPTLVVTGTFDESTPPALGNAVAAAIPGATLIDLPAAHLVNLEAADAYTSAVEGFLHP